MSYVTAKEVGRSTFKKKTTRFEKLKQGFLSIGKVGKQTVESYKAKESSAQTKRLVKLKRDVALQKQRLKLKKQQNKLKKLKQKTYGKTEMANPFSASTSYYDPLSGKLKKRKQNKNGYQGFSF